MTIFVKHLKTGNEYLLIGTAFSAETTLSIPFFRGNLTPENELEESQWVTLCDQKGHLFCLPASEVIVTEIDGKQPSELLEGKIVSPPTNDLENDSIITFNTEAETWETAEEEQKEDEEDEDWI